MNELRIDFNPVPAAQRVARWHGLIRTRLISLAISVAIAVVIGIWKGSQLGTWGWVILIGLTLVPIVWVLVAFGMLQVAKRDLDDVTEGTALRLAPEGLEARGTALGWGDVARLSTRTGGPFRSPQLIVEGTDGRRVRLPLDYLSLPVSEIDNGVRAFSRGRASVDLGGLGV